MTLKRLRRLIIHREPFDSCSYYLPVYVIRIKIRSDGENVKGMFGRCHLIYLKLHKLSS